MRKLYIFSASIFAFVLFNKLSAQPAPTWVARYNGPAGSDQIRAMTVDAKGNVYVTGPSDASRKGNIDYATIKYSSDGAQKWVVRYNGTGNGDDWPNAIAVDAAGNVYVTGRSMGKGTNIDYATVKYDSTGNKKWEARYNSPGNMNDNAKDIAIDANGNVIVTGETDDAYVIGSANSATTIKYDPSNGQQSNIDIYDALPNIYKGTNTNGETAHSIAVDANGNIYLVGSSAGAFFIKYDNSLHRTWTKKIPGSDLHKVLVDASNNIVVTGYSGQTFKYDSNGGLIWQTTNSIAGFWDLAFDQAGNVYVTGEGTDYLTEKYDANSGATVWSKAYAGSANGPDFARSIALDGSGNVYVTGHCTVKSGRNGLEVMGTIKYNNAGDQQWVILYDSTNKLTSDGFVVATDPNGNLYVAGQGISSVNANDYDFVTIRYSPGSNGFVTRHSDAVAENNNTALFSLQNYPNPFINNTTIKYQLPHDGKVKLAIYDLAGKEIAILVNENQLAGSHQVNYDAGKLSPGTYVCKIQCGELNKTKQLTVLK